MIVTSWNGNARRDNADAIAIVMVVVVVVMVIVRVNNLCDLNVGGSFRRLCGALFVNCPQYMGSIGDGLQQVVERTCFQDFRWVLNGLGGSLNSIHHCERRHRAEKTDKFLVHGVSLQVTFVPSTGAALSHPNEGGHS